MEDERVGCPRPARFRHGARQLLLDQHRIVAFRDPDAVRHAQHVAVDRQPWNAERVPQDHVGGLASDARQLDERVHRRGHVAAVLLHERLRHADQGLCLGAVEAGGVNQRLEVGGRRLRERARVAVFPEQRRRHHVHAHVGRLRRQDRRREQLERRPEVQLGISVRVLRLELVDNRAGLTGGLHGLFAISDFGFQSSG